MLSEPREEVGLGGRENRAKQYQQTLSVEGGLAQQRRKPSHGEMFGDVLG